MKARQEKRTREQWDSHGGLAAHPIRRQLLQSWMSYTTRASSSISCTNVCIWRILINLMCKFLSIYVIAYSFITLYFTWHTGPIASRLRHVVNIVYSLRTWRYVNCLKNRITSTHYSVTSTSRRQHSSGAGPRRSSSTFWRHISTADHRFFKFRQINVFQNYISQFWGFTANFWARDQ